MISQMREDISMPNASDQFVKLAQSTMVRRASQAMPHNHPPETDDRFQGLLDRLSQSEKNASLAPFSLLVGRL